MKTSTKLMRTMCGLGSLVLIGLCCLKSQAKINPNFTPIDMTMQSGLILELDLTAAAPDKDGKFLKVDGKVQRVMLDAATQPAPSAKPLPGGPFKAASITLDLSKCALKEQAETLGKTIAGAPGTKAIFFIGAFTPGGGGAGGGGGEAEGVRGYLFVDGEWVLLYENKDNKGIWEMDETSVHLLGTWQGGTDMLIRCVDLILSLKDPGPDEVPCVEGVNWVAPKQFGTIPGKVHAAMPIDLAGDGKLALFVASEGGDKLYQHDAEAGVLKEVTAAKLTSKSIAAAWGDFNGDGRMDLASYDGQNITIYNQSADGSFAPDAKTSLNGTCNGLATLDCGGKAGLLISTAKWPATWIPQNKGDKPQDLPGNAAALKDLGDTYACVVADLDGDGMPDVLLPCARGSLVFKGQKPGVFAEPVPCAIAVGGGVGSAFVGDYDADGLLDVFTMSGEASHLYQNNGRFSFVDWLKRSGEAAYKADAGGIGGITCDFNDDGRQDFILFFPNLTPRSFFSRGFREFGFTNGMDVSGAETSLKAAGAGQQAGTVADFNGDGAQDMVLILNNGDAWVLYREVGGAVLTLRANLPPNSSYHGPLTVTGWKDGRCLGAWNVTPGTSEAFVGAAKAGIVTLKWQVPGQEPAQKSIRVTVPRYVKLEATPAKPGPVGGDLPSHVESPAPSARVMPEPTDAGATTVPTPAMAGEIISGSPNGLGRPIIGLLVLGGAGVALYFVLKKRRAV